MSDSPALCVQQLSHHYGDRCALEGLDLSVPRGSWFAVLGPNGGGKTTLFRLVSTLIPVQSGTISVCGADVRREVDAVRRRLGVVFQAPSLDKKLTVLENLLHQGPLYGLTGRPLRAAAAELLERLGVAERAGDLVETLSGGLRRRVELAKGLLHRPDVLLLDEPTTGLDPGARSDLWNYLSQLRQRAGITIITTTHLLEEAERADQLAILDRGRLVALDTPERLRSSLGGDQISLVTDAPEALAAELHARWGWTTRVIDGAVRFESAEGPTAVARVLALPSAPQIRSLTLSKPTLEDVFLARTGHRFWHDAPPADDARPAAAETRSVRR